MTTRAEVTSRLADAVADAGSGVPLAHRLGETCRTILDGDGTAITLAYTLPQRITVCCTDPVIDSIENLQDVLGEGPGVDAYLTARTVVARIGAAADGPAWPLFTEAARREAGPATVVAVPVPMGSEVVGVLTTYRSGSDHPAPEAGLTAHLAAALGAALLRDPDLADPPGDLAGGLTGAWTSRAEVHQATGFLVAQLGIAPDDALALLRARAYTDDRTLTDVARRVLERTLDLSARTQPRRPPAGR